MIGGREVWRNHEEKNRKPLRGHGKRRKIVTVSRYWKRKQRKGGKKVLRNWKKKQT